MASGVTGNILFSDLGGGYMGVCLIKTHETILYMVLSICVLFYNKKVF